MYYVFVSSLIDVMASHATHLRWRSLSLPPSTDSALGRQRERVGATRRTHPPAQYDGCPEACQ